MPGVLLCAPCIGHREPPLPQLGSYSVDQHVRHLKEHPGGQSYSVVQCKAFDGLASLLFSSHAGLWGERGCGEREMAPPPKHDSEVSPCFHGCLAHCPPRSPPSHSLNPFLCSQQQSSPWDCSTIPKLQLLATATSRGPAFLSG